MLSGVYAGVIFLNSSGRKNKNMVAWSPLRHGKRRAQLRNNLDLSQANLVYEGSLKHMKAENARAAC